MILHRLFGRRQPPADDEAREIARLAPEGFNEIRMCRGGPMVYNKHDIYVGGSLERYGEFSWFEQRLFRQIARPGHVVVEAGANIGAHTVELSRLVGREGFVVAYEPQRIVFQTLCANLALNQCLNVYAYQAALGDKDGTIVAPNVDPNVRANFGGLSLESVPVGDVVPERMLDSASLPGCHFLKVDVEGMEAAVLRGARRTIEKHRPVMFVENDRREKSSALIDLILGLGYELYWHHAPLFNPDNFAGETENIFPNIVSSNMFCVPAESRSEVEGMRRITSPDDWWN